MVMDMDTNFTITSSICETCGTEVLRDEESGAEVHRDITYARCGVEGELASLVEHIEGQKWRGTDAPRPERHLRSVE